MAYLARPDVHEALSRAETDSDALRAVRDELAGLGPGWRSWPMLQQPALSALPRAEPQILATIGALERREAEMATPSALHGFISPGADVARRWQAVPISARREVARMLLAPEMIGELRVTPRPPGWPGGRVVGISLRRSV